jgi:Skp family chaperone for outer membrane proteins
MSSTHSNTSCIGCKELKQIIIDLQIQVNTVLAYEKKRQEREAVWDEKRRKCQAYEMKMKQEYKVKMEKNIRRNAEEDLADKEREEEDEIQWAIEQVHQSLIIN